MYNLMQRGSIYWNCLILVLQHSIVPKVSLRLDTDESLYAVPLKAPKSYQSSFLPGERERLLRLIQIDQGSHFVRQVGAAGSSDQVNATTDKS